MSLQFQIMGYDDVIPLIGGFGSYQRRIYFLLCLPVIITAFQILANVFLQAKPSFRCQLPDELTNSTYELPADIIKAYPDYTRNGTYSMCSTFRDGEVVACDNYIFDSSIYKHTTITEWSLVCDRSYIRAIGDILFMVGVMIGSLTFGDLSDRYGRKLTFLISLIALLIFGTLAAFAPEYWSFIFCRVIVGGSSCGMYLIIYVIALEMVQPKDRPSAAAICQIFFSIGFMLTGVLAYYIPSWRLLQIAFTLPAIAVLTYWWIIPESVRWLITKDRFKEAIQIIQHAAKQNNIQISNSELQSFLVSDIKKDSNEKSASFLEVFKHPNLRRCSLLLFFIWLVNNITYYGLSWNTSNLGGNDYINFVIAGAVEIPGYVLTWLVLNRWGRKAVLCGCMIISGGALLSTALVPENSVWVIITLAMIGKFAITGSYGTVYIFSTEIFPTVLRNAALGACSVSARIGSILAPLVILTTETWKPLPMVIFGILSLVAGGLSLYLPETLNRKLPQTISEGEEFGRRRKLKNIPDVKEIQPLGDIAASTINEQAKTC